MTTPTRVVACALLVLCVAVSFAQDASLRIAVAAPQGETQTADQAQTVFVTFSQPMVPLGAVSKVEGEKLMRIEPPVRGTYQWMGTTTLAFRPEGSFPLATRYVVTVAAGIRSVAGQSLAAPYSWSFETPRPRVVFTLPSDRQNTVARDPEILVVFNQRISPDDAARSISIRQTVGATVTYPKFRAEHPDRERINRDTLTALRLLPAEPFSRGARITVTCKAGLRGEGGPLGLTNDFSFSFDVHGDFVFRGVKSDHDYDPARAVTFVFSTPVTRAQLAAHLRFDPPLPIPQEYLDDTWPSTELYLSFPLQPTTAYRGVVTAGLADRFGNILTTDVPFTFLTSSFASSVRMTTGPGVLEATESHDYPVTFMNVDSVGVQMGLTNPERIVELMSRLDFSSSFRMAMEEGILLQPDRKREEASAYTRSTVWKIKAAKNVKTIRPLNLDAVLGPAKTGVVFAQVDNLHRDPNKRRYFKALIQVTHMGITAKFSPERNLIWVTSLQNARPVAGALVEVRDDANRVAWKGTTDARGVAVTPGWGKLGIARTAPEGNGEAAGDDDEGGEGYEGEQPRQWVLVRKGDDVAFTNSSWNEGLQPWMFGVDYEWNPVPEKTEGVLFTDRGLYKAGEKVDVKGIVRVRRDGGWHLAPGLTTRLVVKNARNEEILTATPRLSPFGSFAASIPLAVSAPLGGYTMELSIREKSGKVPRWRQIAWEGFSVEAFRPAEFEVVARAAAREYVIGDTTLTFLSARYLFGAPLKNETARWRASVSPSQWSPKGFEKYFFGPLRWLSSYSEGYGYRQLDSRTIQLDGGGSATVKVPLNVGELRGPSSLLLEADVTSPTRQVISSRTSVVVHAGEYAIGVAPSSTFLGVDSTLRMGLVAVTPAGTLLPSQKVVVNIYRRIWNSVRRAETGGRYSWISEPADSLIETRTVTTGSSAVEETFVPRRPGFYYIEGKGKDRRGNDLLTHAYLYVSGSGYVPWERSNDDRITLLADKPAYAPGEVAHIMVKSPYESAPALISVEREGILQHSVTTFAGSAPQFDIPITSDMLPNIFVSVVLLQGRSARPGASPEGDIGKPSFKVGYLALAVSPSERKLRVTLHPSKEGYRPGDTVALGIQVRDASGKGTRAEVALSVADLGVLNLIGYRLPDPFGHFYRQRGLAVTTTETRLHIVEQREYGEKAEDDGGGGAAPQAESDFDADGVRKDFRPSAYWNPSVLTDSAGSASVRFKLPDNLTAFASMAVALTEDSRFGMAETSFTVSKPLLLQPSLPRFARVGDSFDAGVVVLNHAPTEKTITLTARARGIAMRGKDSLQLVLAAGAAREVLFTFTAERVGTAVLTVRAAADDATDGLQWSIPVQAPRSRESVVLTGSTTDAKSEQAVVIPDSIYRDIGGLEFTAASTALTGLSGGIAYLFTYPYYCLEQRCSSILPIILAQDLVDAFAFDVFRTRNHREVVQKTLGEIPLFQRGDGGFAYWKNTEGSWSYVSAYAVYTLLQAKKHGYTVDNGSLQRGVEYLRRVLIGEIPHHYPPGAWQCTRSFIVYVLALAGKPDFGYMAAVYNDRATLPLFAKAYLLKALLLAKGDPRMRDELVRDLSNAAKVAPASAHFEEREEAGLVWVYHSTARTTAIVLQTLVEAQPDNPLLANVVRWLIDQQKAGRWRTTQENLYVVDALATYFAAFEKEEPDFRATIAVHGKAILDELFTGRSLKTLVTRSPIGDYPSGRALPVTITKDGKGRLYYGVRMNYYPLGDQSPKEVGLTVTKTLEVQGIPQDPRGPFAPGTVVRVTLTAVTNQDRHFVVLDDPIPAGFEIVNSSFLTTAVTGESAGNGNSSAFSHAERYDDRVLVFADELPAGIHTYSYLARVTRPGVYALPATRGEGMYEPEVFGQTGSTSVVVR